MSQESLGGPLEDEREPVPCRPPILFQPPAPLVAHPEIWITTTGGPRELWDGADVLWSEEPDGDRPHHGGRIGGDAVCGRLHSALAFDSTLVHDYSVLVALDDDGTLPSFSDAAMRRWEPLCYVGDGRNRFELLAYSRAEYVQPLADGVRLFRLSGAMARGLYGTASRSWPPDTRFAFLDAAVARMPLAHRLIVHRVVLSFRVRSFNAPDPEAGEEPALVPLIPYQVV